jgi:hypothetical protein
MRAMFAIYRELGVTDKEPMVADLSELLGRPIASRSDLSRDDLVLAVLPALRARKREEIKADHR